MIQFEDKFMEVQSSMVSLALEYVHGQADKIFIYAIADSLYSYNVFYQINDYIVRKHEVNKYLPEELSVDTNLQSVLLKEHPTEMWLIYDAKKNSLDSRYSYEGRYDKDEELLPRLEFEKWFEEVKEKRV